MANITTSIIPKPVSYPPQFSNPVIPVSGYDSITISGPSPEELIQQHARMGGDLEIIYYNDYYPNEVEYVYPPGTPQNVYFNGFFECGGVYYIYPLPELPLSFVNSSGWGTPCPVASYQLIYGCGNYFECGPSSNCNNPMQNSTHLQFIAINSFRYYAYSLVVEAKKTDDTWVVLDRNNVFPFWDDSMFEFNDGTDWSPPLDDSPFAGWRMASIASSHPYAVFQIIASVTQDMIDYQGFTNIVRITRLDFHRCCGYQMESEPFYSGEQTVNITSDPLMNGTLIHSCSWNISDKKIYDPPWV
jgi:hypothetical protein